MILLNHRHIIYNNMKYFINVRKIYSDDASENPLNNNLNKEIKRERN